jgi:hypothetical protein
MGSNHALGNVKPVPPFDDAVGELIRYWGMNDDEAGRSARGKRQAFLCVMLRVGTQPFGVLYLDSDTQDVFRDAAARPSEPDALDVKQELENLSEVQELARRVGQAMEELRGSGTHLEF